MQNYCIHVIKVVISENYVTCSLCKYMIEYNINIFIETEILFSLLTLVGEVTNFGPAKMVIQFKITSQSSFLRFPRCFTSCEYTEF